MFMRWIATAAAGGVVYSREMLAHRRVDWPTVSRDIMQIDSAHLWDGYRDFYVEEV